MSIVFFLTYYKPHVSGPVRYIEALAKELVKRSFIVTVVTSRHLANLPTTETDENVSIIRVPVLLKIGKGVIMPLLPLTAISTIIHSDVVVVNLPQAEAGLIAVIAKLANKPLIAIHHTDLSGWQGLRNRLSEGVTNLSGKVACRLAQVIVPYTDDYAKYSKFLQPYKAKLTSVHPFINLDKPDPKFRQSLIEKFPKNGDNVKYIGYVGRIAKQKNLEDAIIALDILNRDNNNYQWKLLLAGPLALGEKYGQQLIKSIIHRQDIFWLEKLDKNSLSAFYQFLDVLVLPSNDRLESFGLVQVEAMINGCPVVVTDLPGARIPIGLTGMGKLVPPNQPRILADAIVLVVNDAKLRSPDKVLRAKAIFSPQRTVSQFINLLKKIQGNHR